MRQPRSQSSGWPFCLASVRSPPPLSLTQVRQIAPSSAELRKKVAGLTEDLETANEQLSVQTLIAESRARQLEEARIKEEEQDDGSDREQAEKSISKTKKELEDAEANKAHASGDKTAGKEVANESHIKEDRGEKWTPKRGENAFKTDDDTDTELNL